MKTEDAERCECRMRMKNAGRGGPGARGRLARARRVITDRGFGGAYAKCFNSGPASSRNSIDIRLAFRRRPIDELRTTPVMRNRPASRAVRGRFAPRSTFAVKTDTKWLIQLLPGWPSGAVRAWWAHVRRRADAREDQRSGIPTFDLTPHFDPLCLVGWSGGSRDGTRSYTRTLRAICTAVGLAARLAGVPVA